VLEDVARLGRGAAAEHQPGGEELVDRVLERRLRQPGHGGEELVRELAPDHGPDLRDLPDGRQAVEPGHQRVLQRRRDRERRQRADRDEPVGALPQEARFEHDLGQLLDEQRHALGLGEDLVQDRRRQLAARRHAVDDRDGLRPAEAVQRQQGRVREAVPARRRLGPRRGDEHHR
jgi:hypothetical protein